MNLVKADLDPILELLAQAAGIELTGGDPTPQLRQALGLLIMLLLRGLL